MPYTSWVDTNVNDLLAELKRIWLEAEVRNSSLVKDPTVRVLSFNLPRALWTTLNRIRTKQGKCNYLSNKWEMVKSPLCSCRQKQTTTHIAEECTLTKFTGGTEEIDSVREQVIDWMSINGWSNKSTKSRVTKYLSNLTFNFYHYRFSFILLLFSAGATCL